MIGIDLLRHCETTWYADMTDVRIYPWGRLYHNLENPQSHDGNHAVILDPTCNANAALAEILAAYESMGLTPRIYSSLRPDEGARLRPLLEARGFTFEPDEMRWFVRQRASRIKPQACIDVQRLRALTPGIIALINAERDEPWSIGSLKRHLPHDSLHLLVGLVCDEPVTMASIKRMSGASRVDDVVTHVAHRGKGYARALIHALLAYYDTLSTEPLYLWAENPTAIRLYEEAGFAEHPLDCDFWTAWKDAPAG
ncbi:MAG: GNAT family N-acetyltransferase [Anaerolineae bacterium]